MAFGNFDQNKAGGHAMAEINMIPLIDVMLVLLVIFMITAPMMTHSVKIDLPKASSQVQPAPAVEPVNLAIDATAICSGTKTPSAANSCNNVCSPWANKPTARKCTFAPTATWLTTLSPKPWPTPRTPASAKSALSRSRIQNSSLIAGLCLLARPDLPA